MTARSEFSFSCRPETASRLFGASFFVVDRLTGKPIHIDTGNSYFGLCNLIHRLTKGEDGVYFTYTDDNPIAFNPFYTADKVFDIKKRESIKTLLLTLWKGGPNNNGKNFILRFERYFYFINLSLSLYDWNCQLQGYGYLHIGFFQYRVTG